MLVLCKNEYKLAFSFIVVLPSLVGKMNVTCKELLMSYVKMNTIYHVPLLCNLLKCLNTMSCSISTADCYRACNSSFEVGCLVKKHLSLGMHYETHTLAL